MLTDAPSGPVLLLQSLTRPGQVLAVATDRRVAVRFAAWLVAGLAAVGAVTAAVELVVLERTIDAIVDPAMQVHVRSMQSGFVRLILSDRLMPPATLMLAYVLTGLLATDAAQLTREKRRNLWVLLLVGFTPLLIARVGELAATLAGAGSVSSVGEVVSLPRAFRAGPALFAGPDAPVWLDSLNSRFNLFSLWIAILWVRAIVFLDAEGGLARYGAVVASSLLLSGITTWIWGPKVLALVLNGG